MTTEHAPEVLFVPHVTCSHRKSGKITVGSAKSGIAAEIRKGIHCS